MTLRLRHEERSERWLLRFSISSRCFTILWHCRLTSFRSTAAGNARAYRGRSQFQAYTYCAYAVMHL
jgi:hypothetical protein